MRNKETFRKKEGLKALKRVKVFIRNPIHYFKNHLSQPGLRLKTKRTTVLFIRKTKEIHVQNKRKLLVHFLYYGCRATGDGRRVSGDGRQLHGTIF